MTNTTLLVGKFALRLLSHGAIEIGIIDEIAAGGSGHLEKEGTAEAD